MVMMMHDESRCEVYLDDVLGNRIKHVFLALAHPVSELSEIDLVRSLRLFLLEVFVEDNLHIFQVVEDIIECVADDQHG